MSLTREQKTIIIAAPPTAPGAAALNHQITLRRPATLALVALERALSALDTDAAILADQMATSGIAPAIADALASQAAALDLERGLTIAGAYARDLPPEWTDKDRIRWDDVPEAVVAPLAWEAAEYHATFRSLGDVWRARRACAAGV